MSLTKAIAGGHIPGMDGLRGVAALSVLLAHVRVHLAGQEDLGIASSMVSVLAQGLTLFFALSGFLLYMPFARAILGMKPFPNVRQFLFNRVLRIFPAYWVILLVVGLGLGVAYVKSATADDGIDSVSSTLGYLWDPGLLLTNLTLTHTLFPFSIKTGLGVSWSLTVEMTYYLVVPLVGFIAFACSRHGKRAPLFFALVPPAIFIALGLISKGILTSILAGASTESERFYLEWGANWTAVFARSFLANADLFAFGMIAAILVALVRSARLAPPRAVLLYAGCGLTIVAALIVAKLTYLDDTMFAVIAASLILAVATPTLDNSARLGARVLDWYPFRWFGLISYSVYLWHIPVIWLVAGLFVGPQPFWIASLLVVGITIVLSCGTYFLVEKPALRLKRSQVDPSLTVRNAGG